MGLNAPPQLGSFGAEPRRRGRAWRPAAVAVAFAMAGMLGACSVAPLSENTPAHATLRVADAALASGAPELALRVADLVLARDPKNAPALIARGDALYALGRRDLARVAYRSAVAIDPTAAAAQVGLGRTLAGSDPGAAEAAFLRALAREPDNVVALNNLGVVRDLQGHNAAAQDAYRRALAVAPGSVDVQINLGMSLALSGHSAEAAGLLREVAAVPGATQAWRQELLAGLTLAGDGPWARQRLEGTLGQPSQDPAFADPAFADEDIPPAPGPAPSRIAATPDDRAPVGGPATASLANGEPSGSLPDLSRAPRTIPEALVPEALASVQTPIADPAPRTQVTGTDLPAIASVPDVAPPVAVTPIVRTSSGVPTALPAPPELTAPARDVHVTPSAASVPSAPSVASALPAIASAPDVVPPVPTRPMVRASSRLATALAAQPELIASLDTHVTPPAAAAPRVPKQAAVSQPTTPEAVATRDRGTVDGGAFVQLGALISQPGAMREWHRLQDRLSPFLGGREPTILRAEVHGRTYWRIRTFSFADVAEANELCGRVKAAGLRCWSGKNL